MLYIDRTKTNKKKTCDISKTNDVYIFDYKWEENDWLLSHLDKLLFDINEWISSLMKDIKQNMTFLFFFYNGHRLGS
jgi:hypothetical protein